MTYLTLEHVLLIHELLLAEYDGIPGLPRPHLLESAKISEPIVVGIEPPVDLTGHHDVVIVHQPIAVVVDAVAGLPRAGMNVRVLIVAVVSVRVTDGRGGRGELRQHR